MSFAQPFCRSPLARRFAGSPLLVVALAWATPAIGGIITPPGVFTVGAFADNHCGYHTVRDAINAADSVVWQPDDTLISGNGTETLNLSCNNGSDNTTLPGAVTHNPGFLDTMLNPAAPPVLHLAETSQNIDTCPNAPAPNPAFDLVGSTRLVDVSTVANLVGALDRGAIEYQPPIFEDGFEDP